MATLKLDNLPDELMTQIRQLAQHNNQPIDQQAIMLLKQALKKQSTPLKFLISPETDPTWPDRQQAVPQILAAIEQRRKQRQTKGDWLDSTALIREDRESR
jgi:predicted alpha/beta hydrolase